MKKLLVVFAAVMSLMGATAVPSHAAKPTKPSPLSCPVGDSCQNVRNFTVYFGGAFPLSWGSPSDYYSFASLSEIGGSGPVNYTMCGRYGTVYPGQNNVYVPARCGYSQLILALAHPWDTATVYVSMYR